MVRLIYKHNLINNKQMSILYLYLGIYSLILIGISYYISKKETSEGFLIADRKRSWWTISASKFAGAIGASYFVTYTAYAYEYGTGVYAIILGTVIGYTLFAYWASPKIYKHSRKEKFYTQGDFVYSMTKNNSNKLLTNVVAMGILFLWLMTSIVGGIKIISYFGLMSYELAIVVTTLIVMTYILIAGFRAVVATDVFQSIIIFGLLIFLSFNILSGAHPIEILSIKTGTIDVGTVIGFLLFGILSVFSYSNWYQLCYAAKNERHLKHGIGSAIIPITVVSSFLLFIGLFMKSQFGDLDSGLVFIESLKTFLPINLIPIGVVMFFAGLMSSSDTNIYGIASHYVLSKKTNNPVKKIRVVTVILSVIVMIIAFFWRDIVEITVIAAAATLTLSVSIIYLLLGNNNPHRFTGSVVGSLLGLLVGVVILGIEPTIALTVLTGGLLGLIYNRKEINKSEQD